VQVRIRDAWLPSPKKISETAPSEFIEEHARGHLHEMLKYGARMTGNRANEIDTPLYLLRALENINRNRASAAANGFVMEVDVQRPTG